MKLKCMLFVLIASVVSARPGLAAVPQSFSVQGVLRNGSGVLQTTSVNVIANFYNAASGGTLIAGPYTQSGIQAVNGLFTVTFTDPTLVTALLNANPGAVWLDLNVSGETFPRQQVTAGMFALMSGHADKATVADSATTANSLNCSGCVNHGNIASGAIGAHSHSLSITPTSTIGVSIAPGATTACALDCAAGTTVVSGQCRDNGYDGRLFMVDSFPAGNHWCCRYSNNTTSTLSVAVASICASISTVSLP